MNSNNTDLEKIERWLLEVFSTISLVKNLYLIGSIVSHQLHEVNDIDIVQLLYYTELDELKPYSEKISYIKKQFYNDFGKSLHITTFTKNELDDYTKFMRLNTPIKII